MLPTKGSHPEMNVLYIGGFILKQLQECKKRAYKDHSTNENWGKRAFCFCRPYNFSAGLAVYNFSY